MIDLRSDTVTQPTAEMLDAMYAARLGDDSRDGDPTVGKLEALAVARTGKEAAMFVPSGTMGNLVALMAHTGRGGEVLLEENSHILKYEMGAIAQVAGLFHRTIRGERGAMDLGTLAEAISAQMKPNKLATALIEMETTHNGAGGTVLPLDHMAEVYTLGQQHGIPVHTDGARLFNAAVALGVPAERIARYTDSVTFCVSKGLSAPVGSLLCGTKEFIARARGFRRMLGGNLRQAGMLAAAASWRWKAWSRAWPTIIARQSSSPRACTASPRPSSTRNPSRPTSCASIQQSAAGRPKNGRPRCSPAMCASRPVDRCSCASLPTDTSRRRTSRRRCRRSAICGARRPDSRKPAPASSTHQKAAQSVSNVRALPQRVEVDTHEVRGSHSRDL
jgi:threonine aldolase